LSVLRELNRTPHPNVIGLEGVYESDNSVYVVLELLPGKTLHQAIQDRAFSRGEVRRLVGGVLRGLRHLHASRIMHRDLKPENIMLREGSLEPVLVDFGLAARADLAEYLFFRCGTPGYVAPEIMALSQSAHVEPVCDVFSLGAVFHLLLSGKPLFAGSKFEEVYVNNRELRMDLEGGHLDGASAQAVSLLRRMLAVEPGERSSAEEALSHAYFCD
jgi:calcium-dependent protein kinase